MNNNALVITTTDEYYLSRKFNFINSQDEALIDADPYNSAKYFDAADSNLDLEVSRTEVYIVFYLF